jgi:hypothetical protein
MGVCVRNGAQSVALECSSFPSWPDEDPAIQVRFKAAHPNLDHRVSTLRVGPVMTEKEAVRASRSSQM